MKILLVSAAPYLYALGGGERYNRALVEQLAARGYECTVVSPARKEYLGRSSVEEFRRELARRGLVPTREDGSRLDFVFNGVHVVALTGPLALQHSVDYLIAELEPDIVITSCNDWRWMLLASCVRSGVPVVFLVHCPLNLPFGPHSLVPTASGTELVQKAAALVCSSKASAGYLKRWGGFDATVVYSPNLAWDRDAPRLGSLDNPYVVTLNPSPVKGLAILTELTRRMRSIKFAAVPGWGTSEADRKLLSDLGVALLVPSERIDDVFAQARVVLMPSLWFESYGQVAIQAMVRGIPVVASNVGGLPEAKLGVDYVVPVQLIERFQQDRAGVFVPLDPPRQDIGPWVAVLTELLGHPERYRQIADEGRAKAQAFIARDSVADFEIVLGEVIARHATPKGRHE
jgi:glycosyltransferase involved in cell wall biosynthesis